VYETTLTSDVSYIDIGGLDINKDKVYILYLKAKATAVGGGNMYIFVENNYTLTNYYSQGLFVSTSSVSAGRQNYPIFGFMPSNDETCSTLIISRTKDGFFLAQSITNQYRGASISILLRWVSSAFLVPNITTIRLTTAVSPGFAAGTYVALFKPAG
jgi:hypothetical protein